MEDTAIVIISTAAFILVLINNLTFVIVGVTISLIMSVILIVNKNINIVTRVTTLILSSVTIILGILWLLSRIFNLQ